MAGNIGRQLMGGVISQYIGQGGRMSGALGVLDNLIKQREQQRVGEADITKSLLGVKEVARGVAQQRGLPFVESEEDAQQKKLRDLQITAAIQSTTGTGPGVAMNRANALLKGLQSDPMSIAMAIRAGKTREEFIQDAKDAMIGTYNNLPLESQGFFDETAGDIYDNTIGGIPGLEKFKKKKVSTAKETVTQKPGKKGKVGKYPYTIE